MLAAGYAVASIIGLVGIRVLTELVPPPVFGEANLWLGVVALWGNIFLTPFTSTQVKYHTEYRKSELAEAFTAQISKWTIAAALASGVIGIWAYALVNWAVDRSINLALLLVLLAILTTNAIRNLRLNRLNAERHQGRYAAWLACEAVLAIVVTALCLWFSPTLVSFLVGQWAGIGLGLLVFGFMFYPPGAAGKTTALGAPQQRTVRERVRRYGMPFAAFSVLGWLSHQADRYVLAAFASLAPVGLYAAAFSLGSRPMLLASGVLGDLLRPVLFDAENLGDRKKSERVFMVWLASNATVGLLIVAGYWLLGEWIISLLLAEEYRSGAHAILMWVSVAYTLYGLTQVFENRMFSVGASRTLLIPQIAGAAGNILFALVLVPWQGVVGAAQANALSFGIQLLFTAWFCRRVVLSQVTCKTSVV